MIAYNEQELLYLYHLGSSIAYKLLLDEYKNKIEILLPLLSILFCNFNTSLIAYEKYVFIEAFLS